MLENSFKMIARNQFWAQNEVTELQKVNKALAL